MTQINELLSLKAEADEAYHNLDDPIMTDAEYDALIQRIRAENGEIDMVGATPTGTFAKHTHASPMMSLDNAFTVKDVADWYANLGGYLTVTSQNKLDGLSLSLIYLNGELCYAATRGDGKVGEDVTEQAKRIANIPHWLKNIASKYRAVEVRGEVVMPKQSFLDLNDALIEQGKKPFANPRNAAAGSLRQKDPAVTASRGLSFIAFGVTPDTFADIDSERSCLDILEDNGVTVELGSVIDTNHVETLNFCHTTVSKTRSMLPFDIDGLVYKVDSRSLRAKLGATSRAPRWAIAHKFAAERTVTRLLDIDWQVGRTGVIAPVARLEPVNVGGVLVSSATLHNIDEIKRLGVLPGAVVEIQRAGDVIPQVLGVVGEEHIAGTAHIPTHCPSCGGALIRQDAYIRCTAGKDCDAQFLGFLEHFASRDAMNIDGLGPSQIKDLFDQHWLLNASDIMKLPDEVVKEHGDTITMAEALEVLPGWGKTSAKKLMAAIKRARTIDLDRFIYALGIPQIGKQTAKDLAKWCGSVDKFFVAANEEGGFTSFQLIDGIGPATIDALEAHWTDYHLDEAFALRSACDIKEPKQADDAFAVFKGMTIVFTGGLNRWSRDTASLIAEELGAKITNSISKKTTVLVAGSDTGKVKITNAAKCGTEVWNEFEFIQRVEEAVAAGYELDVME